ncbi:MAG TPA: glycosyltransferase family 39 protein, partial [Gemmataceae bacterium]|nr:glycosyltransferase family 39 protein [Gemmataceae bacterium]
MVRSWWVDVGWVLAFGLASSVWCLTAATKLGATFDEPHHLNAGLTSWRTGSNKLLMSAGCMPLPVDVQTLPIYLWERHRGVEFHQYKEIETILPVARAANLVFWWALLVYAMLLGRTFRGPWAGRLAVGFVACDPNFLAHAALATTDISIVAAMLALIYHYHHGQGRGWWARVFVPGFFYGLATLAKASGMIFGVQAMLVLSLCHLYRTGALAAPAGSTLRGKLVHV